MKKIFESDLDSLSLEEEDLLFEKLAKELGLELFKLGAIKKEVAFLLSLDQMRYFEAIIIKKEEKTLLIALKNPFEKSYQETLKMIFSNFSIVFGLIKNRDFKAAISWLEREELLQKLLERIPNEIAKDSKEENSSILEFLKLILQEAVCKGASDVHFERDFETMRIRLRIDGVLVEYLSLESWLLNPLSSCIKLLSHLNITETRIPQDGRFSLSIELRNQIIKDFDFRVSTLPLIEGESIVLRILDKQKTLMPLETLGFSSDELEKITNLFNLPYGLVFITGPTGSGKSTTMYGILNILKERNLKIITLEDPVEYRLKHISQVAIGAKINFASILRNVLRQDPDVIILGEVRDKETLQIAIQAAFTGHLVFATLHTNDSLDTIVRLLDMGLESYFISQALSGIIAQRLLRKLCRHCR
ncbi:MAG: ATPase, T2SS/T4P/T4SS family, partial [Helicobacter sp.]